MMKNYIIMGMKALVLLLLTGAMAGCNEDNIPTDMPQADGKVPFRVQMDGSYRWLPSRANHPVYKDEDAMYLPDNSTVRLIILKGKPSGVTINETDVVRNGEELGHTYLVRTDSWGIPYLYPCEVDEDGKLIPGTESLEPYYLPVPKKGGQGVTEQTDDKGTYYSKSYYCMAISPARALKVDTDGLVKLSINNQEELLVTNNHWDQTKWSEFEVTSRVEKESTVQLNPLTYATARIRIYIRNGEHVTEMIPGVPIVEIDRVPSNPGTIWYGDKKDEGNTEGDNVDGDKNSHLMPTYNLAVGDSIKAQMGNNILYNRMTIDQQQVRTWTEMENGLSKRKVEILAETFILPMDARPTPMIIRLNVGVNQTPMQFQYQSNRLFRAGHTYDYVATLALQEGMIYIASWQDMQWNADLYPNP